MKFNELSLNEKIMKGIDDAKFIDCMPVQEETFKISLKGHDVCVQSQTGSGKTVAFLVTVFHLLLEKPHSKDNKALIIAPTRELAVQIEDEAKIIGGHLPLRIGCFYGGVGYGVQEQLLKQGVDVLIGTPGRLIDYSQSGKIDFRQIRILIIDEADRLFDMGFYPDLRRMLSRMRPPNQRVTMLFSATLGMRVKRLAHDHMNEPKEVSIMPQQVTVDEVTQRLYHVGRDDKFKLLLGIMKKENPASVLIFTNTKIEAERVSKRLNRNGYPCEFIMGDLPQNQRQRIIDGIKAGAIKSLVATNVAARGLHIDDLAMVVNYDIPEDPEDYVHRIGRTARVGKQGLAITLACPEYVDHLDAVEKYTKIPIPVEWPGDDMYVEPVDAADARSSFRRDRNFRDRNSRDRHPRDRNSRRPPHRDRNERRERVHDAPTPAATAAAPGTSAPAHEAPRPHQPQRDHRPRRDHRDRGRSGHPRPAGARPERAETRSPDQQRPDQPAARSDDRPAAGQHRRDVSGRREKVFDMHQHRFTNMTESERLNFYRRKYGENISSANTPQPPAAERTPSPPQPRPHHREQQRPHHSRSSRPQHSRRNYRSEPRSPQPTSVAQPQTETAAAPKKVSLFKRLREKLLKKKSDT